MATIDQALKYARLLVKSGKLSEATRIGQQIIEADNTCAEAWYILGAIANHEGRYSDAISLLLEAVQRGAPSPAYHNSLGEAYSATGNIAGAIDCFQRALELNGRFPQALYNLAMTLHWLKTRPAEAVQLLRQAIAARPDYFDAAHGLAWILYEQGQLDQAIEAFRRAVEIRPRSALAWFNLANTLRDAHQLTDSLDAYRSSLTHNPHNAPVFINLGAVLFSMGRIDEARSAFDRSHVLSPQEPRLHSQLLAAAHVVPSVTLTAIAQAHDEYEHRHAAPLRATWRLHSVTRDPERRLRIGFLSPMLWNNPAGHLLLPVLESLTQHDCETYAYSHGLVHDEITLRMEAAVSQWHDVADESDDALADRIRSDGIDILFDIAGHLARNRLLVFARKPAPLQVTWLAYEGTTGLAAMDFIVADPYIIPADAERHYRERILRLPKNYVCYTPWDDTPDVGPLPAQDNGYVTFGSFSGPHKINSEVIATWAVILRELPNSKLFIKQTGFDLPDVYQRYVAMFAAQGVPRTRLEFEGTSPLPEALQCYNRVDIALDTFPFSGSLTTCDALWMGVPVITLPTETFAGRHSLSHLSNVGYPEFIARDRSDYTRRAAHLANDLERLSFIREGLRKQIADSPLCDAAQLTSNLFLLLRQAWRDWCRAGF